MWQCAPTDDRALSQADTGALSNTAVALKMWWYPLGKACCERAGALLWFVAADHGMSEPFK